jgi:C1q-related factor
MIGSVNVKSTPVYFHVQRNSTFSSPNQNVTIPFNIEVTNVGNAMDLTSGIFTAPKTGTYFFAFSGIISDGDQLYVSLMLNGYQIASTTSYSPYRFSLSINIVSTLKLEADDEVSLSLSGYYLFEEADKRYTQFTGILLQEELSF